MSVGDRDYALDGLTAADGVRQGNGNGAVTSLEHPDAVAATMDVLDTRTIEILKLRRAFRAATHRRGWLVRRMLVVADVIGLAVAFVIAQRLFEPAGASDRVHPAIEYLIFLGSIPVWIVAAHIGGLYDRDGELTDHSTADDLVGVFVVVTVGTWLVASTAWVTKVVGPNPPR